MEDKYTPSGTTSISGILTTIVMGIAASIVLPIFYIVLSRLVPNIWFIAIIAVFLGMGLGFFIDLGVKVGKIRNKKTVTFIAVGCGLLAFYVQWVLFDTLMYSPKGFTFKLAAKDFQILGRDFLFLFTHPNILFNEIVNLNAFGTFRIDGTGTVKGMILWIIWAGEFAVILGGALFGVLNGQVTQPYSEINDEWMKRRKNLNRIPVVENKDEILRELSKRNFGVLNHNPAMENEENYAEVIVFESPGDSTKYINIINVVNPTGKKKDKKILQVIKYLPVHNANF